METTDRQHTGINDQAPRELDQPSSRNGQDHAKTPVEVHVERLHKAFGANRVLRGVELKVNRGDLLAVVGGSGSGKTVLLEHIIGHHQPNRGRVFIANHDLPGSPLVDINAINEQEMDRLRTHWAVVFQRNALFSGSVQDNIAMWLREIKRLSEDEILPIAMRSLKAVGFDDPATILKKDRDELSGGMAKRVAVARAISMEPKLLFYDEPTTGLDPTLARQIHMLIQSTHDSRPGQTTLIITHDKELLYRLQPRVVMLYDGKVFFDGSYIEFEQTDSAIIRPYFDLMPGLQRRQLQER